MFFVFVLVYFNLSCARHYRKAWQTTQTTKVTIERRTKRRKQTADTWRGCRLLAAAESSSSSSIDLFGGSWCNALSRLWLCALAEAIAGTSEHVLQVAHTSSAGGVSSLGLLAPVVLADGGSWEAARRAALLLDVVRAATASATQRVRLVVSLTETLCTLGHFCLKPT